MEDGLLEKSPGDFFFAVQTLPDAVLAHTGLNLPCGEDTVEPAFECCPSGLEGGLEERGEDR